jgi:ribosomal protein L32
VALSDRVSVLESDSLEMSGEKCRLATNVRKKAFGPHNTMVMDNLTNSRLKKITGLDALFRRPIPSMPKCKKCGHYHSNATDCEWTINHDYRMAKSDIHTLAERLAVWLYLERERDLDKLKCELPVDTTVVGVNGQ